MPVNQNITNFYRAAAARDFTRDFLFRVTDLNINGVAALTEADLIYVKAASLPGRNIGNVPVPYMGLTLNVPGSVTYPGSDSYSLTFYLDASSYLRDWFEAASRAVFDDKTSGGMYGTPGDDSYILLTQLDKELNPITNYKLVGVSIRNIGNIDYKISDGTGATLEISTTFAYHFYEQLPI